VGLISNYIRFVCLASLLLLWASNGHAAATITFSQVGNDVQATVTGTLNLTGLSLVAQTEPYARVRGGGTGAI